MKRMIERVAGVIAAIGLGGMFLPASAPGAPPAIEVPAYDIIVQGGTVYDGTGSPGEQTDVGIDDGKVVFVGDLSGADAKEVIDAEGLAVAPGFINMLSWATESLLVDGRSQSDIRQGVTLQVMGEGWSMGPLTPEMREEMLRKQADYSFEVPWTSLGEYLDHA